jgi:hypothetical protein
MVGMWFTLMSKATVRSDHAQFHVYTSFDSLKRRPDDSIKHYVTGF